MALPWGLKVLGGDSGRYWGRMGAFDQGGVGSPACGFEGRGAEKVLIEGDESLSDTVGDFGQVACTELVRNQAVVLNRSSQPRLHLHMPGGGRGEKRTYSSTWITDIVFSLHESPS